MRIFVWNDTVFVWYSMCMIQYNTQMLHSRDITKVQSILFTLCLCTPVTVDPAWCFVIILDSWTCFIGIQKSFVKQLVQRPRFTWSTVLLFYLLSYASSNLRIRLILYMISINKSVIVIHWGGRDSREETLWWMFQDIICSHFRHGLEIMF